MTENQEPLPLPLQELAALRTLKSEYQEHIQLVQGVADVLADLFTTPTMVKGRDLSQSKKVTAVLLTRLLNDLRCTVILAERGYALQAACLVATVFEVAYGIAMVGKDNSLAEEWIKHQDPTQAFKSAWEMLSRALPKLGVKADNELLNMRYRDYRRLCLAKHVNPLLQQDHGFNRRGTDIVVGNGPDLSESAIQVTWFCLYHAAFLGLVAFESYAKNHATPQRADELRGRVSACYSELSRVKSKFKERWGPTDPLKELW